MMEHTIVEATLADLARVTPLLRAQWDEHEILLGVKETESALTAFLERPELGTAFLALDSAHEAIGLAVIALTWTLEKGGLVAWLDELYVAPTHRGAGVGTVLLAHATRYAEHQGCKSMELEVVEGHDRAANLYARESFTRIPRARWSRKIGR